MTTQTITKRPFTGRHMAFIMVGFFAVVISVNFTMAYLATQSWTGLVVPNAYVASQNFDAETAKREAALARGDQIEIRYEEGRITITARDKAGKALTFTSAELNLHRNISSRQNTPLTLRCAATACEADVALAAGSWTGDLLIKTMGQRPWQQAFEIFVREK